MAVSEADTHLDTAEQGGLIALSDKQKSGSSGTEERKKEDSYPVSALHQSPELERGKGSCSICYEDFYDTSRMIEIPTCGHEFCSACLSTHCQNAIATKMVPIPCAAQACNAQITPESVETLLENYHDWNRFQKLHSMSLDSSLQECPACENLFSIRDGKQNNDVKCVNCNHTYCLEHGPSHAGMSCAEFAHTKQAKAILKTERMLDQFTKPCSRCGCRIQRSSGCDYMVCGHCWGDICWKCGTHVHLETSEKGHRTCTQCKMSHAGPNQPLRVIDYVWLVFGILIMFIFSVFYVVVAVVIAVASCCYGGCFACGRCLNVDLIDDDNEITTRRTKGEIRHGVATAIFVTFYPIGFILDEAELLQSRTLQEVFPEILRGREIPAMTTDAQETNVDAVTVRGGSTDKEEEGNIELQV